MHLVRRTAFRAASSAPSTSFLSKSRSINTSSPLLLRSKVQASRIAPSVFRRFASDEASSPLSADGQHEQSSIHSAVDSATSDAAESLSSNAEQTRDAFAGAAAGTSPATDFAFRDREPTGRYDGGRFDGAGRPSIDLVPTTSIYVGNLLFDITAGDLQREFGTFGQITATTIATDPRGMSKGFGYVEFETIEAATAAIEAKHQSIFEGRRMIVNYQNKTKREQKENPPSKTLFIGNLAFEMSDADLNKLFRDIRNVLDVRVAIDRRTGQPRGFAHADFVDVESATKGLQTLKDKEIYGRRLRVDFSLGQRQRVGMGDGNASGGGRSF